MDCVLQLESAFHPGRLKTTRKTYVRTYVRYVYIRTTGTATQKNANVSHRTNLSEKKDQSKRLNKTLLFDPRRLHASVTRGRQSCQCFYGDAPPSGYDISTAWPLLPPMLAS